MKILNEFDRHLFLFSKSYLKANYAPLPSRHKSLGQNFTWKLINTNVNIIQRRKIWNWPNRKRAVLNLTARFLRNKFVSSLRENFNRISFSSLKKTKILEKVERCRRDKESTKIKYTEALQELNRANPKYMDDMKDVGRKFTRTDDRFHLIFFLRQGLRSLSNFRTRSSRQIPRIFLECRTSRGFDRQNKVRRNDSRKFDFRFSIFVFFQNAEFSTISSNDQILWRRSRFELVVGQLRRNHENELADLRGSNLTFNYTQGNIFFVVRK